MYVFICFTSQAPEELQRLVNLVKEEPLPEDAPPLPEENQSEDTAEETDGGEGFTGLTKSSKRSCSFQITLLPPHVETANYITDEKFAAGKDIYYLIVSLYSVFLSCGLINCLMLKDLFLIGLVCSQTGCQLNHTEGKNLLKCEILTLMNHSLLLAPA